LKKLIKESCTGKSMEQGPRDMTLGTRGDATEASSRAFGKTTPIAMPAVVIQNVSENKGKGQYSGERT